MAVKELEIKPFSKKGYKSFKFEEIAFSISERVEPKQTDLEIYVGLEHIDPDSIHIKRHGTPADVEGTKLKVYPGDLIFGKRRAYQRKAAVANFEGICSAHAMVLRANPNVIIPELFPFFIHSDQFMNRAIDISVGSLSPTINWGTLKTQEFVLPALEQQVKLAKLLWAGDDVIENYKLIYSKALVVYNRLLTDLYNLKGKKDIRLISEVVEILDNKRIPLSETERNKRKGEVPYYGANGQVGTIDDYIFNEDLVLIAEDGGNFNEYKTRPIAYKISGKSWVNNHAHVLKPKVSELSIDWLYYNLVHRDITKFIIGSTRTKLNKSELMKIPFYCPSIKEQERQIGKINVSFEALTKIERNISSLSKIQKQLINQIFGV